MPEYILENQGTETMLVCHLVNGESLDGYAKGMLQNNDIEGVIKPLFTQRDNDQYLKYKVTSRISLRDLCGNDWKKEMFLKVICSVITSIKEAEEYMLTESRFLLDLDHIYVNISTKNIYLIYVPLVDETQGNTLKDFFREFITAVRFDLSEDTSYVAQLINAINHKESLDLNFLQNELMLMTAEKKPAQKTESKELYSVILPGPPEKEIGEVYPMPDKISDIKTPSSLPSKEVIDPYQEIIQKNEEKPEKAPKKGLFSWLKREKKKKKETAQIGDEIPNFGFDIPGQTDGFVENRKKDSEVYPEETNAEIIMNIDPDSGRISPPEKKLFGGFHRKTKTETDTFSMSNIPQNQIQSRENYARPQYYSAGNVPQQAAVAPTIATARGNSIDPKGIARPAEEGDSVIYGAGNSSESNTTIIMGGGEDISRTVSKQGLGQEAGMPVFRMVTLQRRSNGQKIAINKSSFKIGSNGGYVDFYIGDNGAIGAMHAEIQKKDGSYYIRDLNSLNHTFVNRKIVNAGELAELHSGDIITLADEDFEFMVK